MGPFRYIFSFLIGLCFGSFATVVTYRLPRGKSVVRLRSSCVSCSHRLGVADLVPVFSWITLQGRCRYCKNKISVRYLLVELLCGILFLCMARLTVSPSLIPLAAFAFVLLQIAIIDMDTKTIPDGLVIGGMVSGLLWVVLAFVFPGCFPLAPLWYDALLGALVGGLSLFVLDRLTLLFLKKDGFGYGDVKLMAMAGLYLGWQLAIVALFVAFVAAGVYAGFLLFTGRAKRGEYIAFGPYICAGSLLSLWFSEPISYFIW